MSADKLIEEEDYPGMLNGDNLAEVLKAAKAKKQKIPFREHNSEMG